MPGFRPRLKFSLCTLLVMLSILGVGLGWLARERKIVRERNAALELLQSRKSAGSPKAYWYTVELKVSEPTWIRKCLGDLEPIHWEFMGVFEAEEYAFIDRVLPEANLKRHSRVELSIEEQLQLYRPQN